MVDESIFKIGDMCGQSYRIARLLMRNAWIEKYLVKHKDTGNKALLTCSRFQHLPGDPPSPELFKANAERIRSAPLVEMPKVYDFGIQGGVYWIAVQYIDAPNVVMLNQQRKDGSPEWRVLDAASIAGVLSYTLDDLEKCGLMHGHLTPEHLVIDGMPLDMNVFLLDAGFADLFQFNGVAARHYLRYCAPEILNGKVADKRADIYSLGMILYHLIAQHPPFWDKIKLDSDGALIPMVLEETPRDLREFAYCPDGLWDLILRAIEKDPDKRFQSADELYEHVQLALNKIEKERRVIAHAEKVRAEAKAKNTADVPLVVRKDRNESDEPKTGPRGPTSDLNKRAAWLHALQHAIFPTIGKQESSPAIQSSAGDASDEKRDAHAKAANAPVHVIAEVSAKAMPDESVQGPCTHRSGESVKQGAEKAEQTPQATMPASPEQKPSAGRPWLGKAWRWMALASVLGGVVLGVTYLFAHNRHESFQSLDLARPVDPVRPVVSIEIHTTEPEKALACASPTCVMIPAERCSTCEPSRPAQKSNANKSDSPKDAQEKKAAPDQQCSAMGAIFCFVPR